MPSQQENTNGLLRPCTLLYPQAQILTAALVVGGKEMQGPLADCFDFYNPDDRFGQTTWEQAESEMQRMAMAGLLGKASLSVSDIGVLIACDLLNRCTGSAYGLLSYDVPYFGLYEACPTAVGTIAGWTALKSNGKNVPRQKKRR